MKKARMLLILGVWVAVLPYLGFPRFWKNLLFTLTGLGLAYFAYVLYREFKRTAGEQKPEVFDNFSENSHLGPVSSEVKNEGNN